MAVEPNTIMKVDHISHKKRSVTASMRSNIQHFSTKTNRAACSCSTALPNFFSLFLDALANAPDANGQSFTVELTFQAFCEIFNNEARVWLCTLHIACQRLALDVIGESIDGLD
jgi:hypothetical protein